MNILLKLEELLMFLTAIILVKFTGIQLWIFIVFFLAPDIGMLGYLINERIGACSYNLLHHKGISLMLVLAGYFSGNNILMFAGLVMFAHSSFDRILGYGLKYTKGFKFIHLGIIGKRSIN